MSARWPEAHGPAIRPEQTGKRHGRARASQRGHPVAGGRRQSRGQARREFCHPPAVRRGRWTKHECGHRPSRAECPPKSLLSPFERIEGGTHIRDGMPGGRPQPPRDTVAPASSPRSTGRDPDWPARSPSSRPNRLRVRPRRRVSDTAARRGRSKILRARGIRRPGGRRGRWQRRPRNPDRSIRRDRAPCG